MVICKAASGVVPSFDLHNCGINGSNLLKSRGSEVTSSSKLVPDSNSATVNAIELVLEGEKMY